MKKKDNRYFELRQLTENIFLVRQLLDTYEIGSESYNLVAEKYNELCNKRCALEEEIFNKKVRNRPGES